jgi:hypothetical protein
VLHAGRLGEPQALDGLARLVAGGEAPGIVRASALRLLRNYPGRVAFEAITGALSDEEPLVREAALSALEMIPPQSRLPLASDRLGDPVRAVRIAAVRTLAEVPREMWQAQQSRIFEQAFQEAVDSEMVNSDRPEAHLSLGVLYAWRGRQREAEASYRTALRLDPGHIEARINLADLYRSQGRDDEGEPILREALRRQPDSAAVHHSLGLLLARAGRHDQRLRLRGGAQLPGRECRGDRGAGGGARAFSQRPGDSSGTGDHVPRRGAAERGGRVRAATGGPGSR